MNRTNEINKCFNWQEAIVTCFGVGRVKYAPGTLGSLLAYPFLCLVFFIYIGLAIALPLFKNIYLIYGFILAVLLGIFIVGCKFSQNYIDKYNKEDPSEIIIDEVVGQGLVLLLILPLNIHIFYQKNILDIILYFIAGPFILFRLFDIIKPWPISWFDKNVKGGIGVMLDDVIAALLAAVVYYNLYYILH